MAEHGYHSTQALGDSASQFNAIASIVSMLLGRIATATLVRVQAVTTTGAVAPAGYVDILPLVNQVDGAGNAEPHRTIYRAPYFRLYGGSNAVILDPQVGDIGVAIFADHDISSAVTNNDPANASGQRGQANPGSGRRFSMADAIYLGGLLGDTPNQFVRFSSTGIEIHSPDQVKLQAPDVTIDCDSLTVTASGAVAINSTSLTHNGINVGATHRHSGVSTGGGNTGVPV